MSSRGLTRKMARVQPQGIANRNVWAKEETPLTRVEKKLPEQLEEKQLRTVTTEARRERISVEGWWARCFPPKIIISIPSLGSSITHRSSHISQRAGMNPLILQSLTMSAPTSLPCHHFAVLCLVAQSCPTLCNPMKCMPGSSVHGDSSGKNSGVSCHVLLQGSFQPRDRTQVSRIAGRLFTIWATSEALSLPYFRPFPTQFTEMFSKLVSLSPLLFF